MPASLVPGGAADSAGFPWAGRTFDHHETAFAGDDGSTPAELAAAIASLRTTAARFIQAGEPQREALEALAQAHSNALLAVSGCRVLVPLLAEAGELGYTPDGRVVEKTQELSIVTVAGPDGRRVMPVFSSVDTMRTWNPEARPIPVPMPQAAIAAAQEGTDLIIVDPGTPSVELGIRRTQLEAVARALPCTAPWVDPAVMSAFQLSSAEDPRVLAVHLLPSDPEARLLAPELDVVLVLKPGLSQGEVNEVLARVQQRWSVSESIANRVDSLRIRLV